MVGLKRKRGGSVELSPASSQAPSLVRDRGVYRISVATDNRYEKPRKLGFLPALLSLSLFTRAEERRAVLRACNRDDNSRTNEAAAFRTIVSVVGVSIACEGAFLEQRERDKRVGRNWTSECGVSGDGNSINTVGVGRGSSSLEDNSTEPSMKGGVVC